MKSSLFRLASAVTVVCGMAGLWSCKDYLEVTPLAYNTTEATFSSLSGASGAVTGVYDLLSGDNTYGKTVSLYFPYDTDEFIGQSGASQAGRRAIARYAESSTDAEVENGWIALYQGVERANICIKYIPQMPQYAAGPDSATLHHLHGEVLALRAQFMHELIRNWGDVPAPREPSIVGKQFPNEDRLATYTQLIADLDQASKLVLWRSAGSAERERFTRGGVMALRARLALARGGYYPKDGREDNRAGDYKTYLQLAHDICQELMSTRHTGEHSLNPSYSDIFLSINHQQADATHELMLEVGHGTANSAASSDSKLGYYNGPKLNSPTYGTSSGAITVAPPYFYAFDSTDLRRDLTIAAYNRATTTGGPSDNKIGVALDKANDGKFRRDWHIPAVTGSGNYLGYNWPLIRFADVVLMFAETENELNGPTTAAVNALLSVRRRGFGANQANASRNLNLATQAAFRTALQNERLVEFGGEGIRKYDLLRWGLLGTKILETQASINKMATGAAVPTFYGNLVLPASAYYKTVNGEVQWATSFYKALPSVTPAGTTRVNWTQGTSLTALGVTGPAGTGLAAEYVPGKGKELLPIPQKTIDATPGLRQNMGY
ncbi:RagB/SusD family nutrient uptake outer membrane protein [Hymenobacter negativus]|uniref:RagB/SusD family nutrient uptake outer membrane protein n=1 Tax=Hymenobacter negativus TaxID=2795026 RepID=A0ABS0QA86_9BACT|nr:RagB/SusD family nutrient uptake outer membrane protein [Hymenobacter negativus]MBH8559136.1 RagB/SusD family nutrient uptake outer membrane protein [Hymenobacter negativus]